MDAIRDLFSSAPFMPHGHCYLWQPAMLWTQVLSNSLIALSYIAISTTLGYLVYRIRGLPFRVMYLVFGVFIISCGFTHILDVVVIWDPRYWIDGLLRSITAVASVGTAVALPWLVPRAVGIARGAQAAHVRGIALETAVTDLGHMYERTRELEQLKTQLFANVSHELRTPLALILGPAEKLLADPGLSDGQRADLEVIGRNARSLLRQVNDLLDLSKLEAGAVKVEYADIDVALRLRALAAQFEGAARERGVRFAVELPEHLPGQLDADKLLRIVLNLLSNAFKFTPPGGTVRLAARRDERLWLHLEVADSGPGIPAAQRDAVFERFRQLDGGSKRRFGGTGLGLTIARDFARLHGGELGIADAPEGGARFVLELPLVAPNGAELRHEPTSTLGDSAATAYVAPAPVPVGDSAAQAPVDGDARPRVLLVEDNPDMSLFMRGVLRRSYRVTLAADGRRGLEAALARRPDLIITDVMMPEVSGDALVGELRKHAELDGVPILVVSAKPDDELRVRLLREGAQDYLIKPFSTEELVARAGNLVATARTRAILQSALDSQQHDLTALAAELSQNKHDLGAALEQTRQARAHAERASQFKSDFLSLISHELKTPLNALNLQLERIRRERERLSDKQASLLDRALGSVARLGDLVESLLQYSRIEQDRLVTDLADVDVSALAGEVLEELGSAAEQKGLALRLEAPTAVRAFTDARILRLVLVNLVGNAVKFTETGSIEVRVEGGARPRIAVRDTGRGIAPEDQARVFEPFEQLEQIRHKHTSGVGLGLALVRELSRALGASIELESALGRGSTFTIVLPSSGPGDA